MFALRLLSSFAAVLATLAAPALESSSVSSSVLLSSASPAVVTTVSSSLISLGSSASADTSSTTFSAESEEETVSPASDAANTQAFPQGTTDVPQAINEGLGATVIAPDDVALDQQNPDLFAPPTTDNGNTGNAKWPFALSHNRIQTGGWARQQNVEVMPLATSMASVDMRLTAGSIRELHWHTTAEWAYVLKGSVMVTAINTDGQDFVDKVNEGDLWYFPPGIPHSLQATNDDPDGAEFLLVFDDGSFSEDSTFLLTDWTAHIPKEVLAKNFGTSITAFDHIPSRELYIFPAPVPSDDESAPSDPAGTVPNPFTYKLSQANAMALAGGSMKVFDPSVFPVATAIVGTLVNVEPGGMRELHWHPTESEWSFVISGQSRMTLFASSENAQTFDYQAGDIGYVPPSFGHYVENTGNTTLTYLELFNSDKVEDISLQQWLALTPSDLVKEHLGLDDSTIASLNKTKQYVVGPSS